jgi:hypothetical protein
VPPRKSISNSVKKRVNFVPLSCFTKSCSSLEKGPDSILGMLKTYSKPFDSNLLAAQRGLTATGQSQKATPRELPAFTNTRDWSPRQSYWLVV